MIVQRPEQQVMIEPNAVHEMAGPSHSEKRRSRLLAAFFVGWTAMVALVWWRLVTITAAQPEFLITYGASGGKPWAIRFQEWSALAFLNFHWAIGWLLFGPYVLWIASRFHVAKERWPWRLTILILSGVLFVTACDALARGTGVTQNVMVFVTSRAIPAHGEVTEGTNGTLKSSQTTTASNFVGVIVGQPPASHRPPWLEKHLLPDDPLLSPHLGGIEGFAPGGTNRIRFERQVRAERRRPPLFFAMDSAAWFGLIGLAHALHFHRRYRERERQAGLLTARLTEARLRALREQLQPHFLFNALNGIATLVRRDPVAAQEMLVSLSELLRLTLSQNDRQEISLREELDFVERYLEIQRMRFGERLTVHTEYSPATLDCAVPPLVLQPLVENAIRHGIEPLGKPGTVRIVSRREHEDLILRVEDDGMGINPAPGPLASGHGQGVASLRERLAAVYGTGAQLELRSRPEGGTFTEVRLPFRASPTNDSRVTNA